MALREQIKIKYNRADSYTNTQNNYVGAQSTAGKRGTLPSFQDSNTKYVAKTGSDSNPGTSASPYLTIQYALNNLGGAFLYAVIKDSGTYREKLNVAPTLTAAGGLYAADGQAPIIERGRGAYSGTFGSRKTGRTKFSTGSYPSTFYFVSKAGSDGTGTRGNPALPFLTIQAALNDGSRLANDTIQIEDDGVYVEDLTIGSQPVTIQAKDGKVPTIKHVSNNQHLNSTVGLKLYGLNLFGLVQPSIITSAIRQNAAGAAFEAYDCTITNYFYAIEYSNGNDCDIHNCYFLKQEAASFYHVAGSTGPVDVENCHFDQCGVLHYTGGVRACCWINGPGSGVTWPAVSIRDCSFTDAEFHQAACIHTGDAISGYTAGGLEVKNCLFTGKLMNENETLGLEFGTASSGSYLRVENCYFYRMSSIAVDHSANATLLELDDVVAEECGFILAPSSGADFREVSGHTHVMNAVSLNSSLGGFYNSQAGAGALTCDYKNLAVINCEQDAFYVSMNAGTHVINIQNYAQKGVGASKLGLKRDGPNGTLNISFSVLNDGTGGSGSIVTKSYVLVGADPLFLDETDGSYNVGLDASGPCPHRGVENYDIGMSGHTLKVSSSNYPFTIDGLIFQGDINFVGGIDVAEGVAQAITIRYCSFLGLGTFGVKLNYNTEVKYCRFKTNGFGPSQPMFGGIIWYCTGEACRSAFIILGGAGTIVQNNSAHGCDYGQFDTATATPAVLKNNVYAGSGTEDYHGNSVQDYSIIPVLSEGASLTNGSQNDPLFRDVAGNYVGADMDLRIQAKAEGFFFNSPAIAAGDDTKDAGAFDFTYGSVSTVWDEIDFSTGTGTANPYRNPDYLQRLVVPIKLKEGDTDGGEVYSVASDFLQEYVLGWRPTNDMPLAQVNALITLFITGDGKCQITFDNGTSWIDVQLIRSAEFLYAENDEASYSSDDLPTPVRELRFRETN